MDSTGTDCDEPSVNEGAFWHTNLDLYYGYLPGEIVEVEHESSKYWLAKIQYCYKHLVLLKWVGNYGEFWMDISQSNAAIGSTNTLTGSSIHKRLFPLGHHLQSQLKSQFTLEKPTKVLVAPSLYDPACDPYANIKTVDDLLAHEEEEHVGKDDAFLKQTVNENLQLALACKGKIQYKQEDVDELETALQNLGSMEVDEEAVGRLESPDIAAPTVQVSSLMVSLESGDKKSAIKTTEGGNDVHVATNKDSGIDSEPSSERPSASPDRKDASDGDKSSTKVTNKSINITVNNKVPSNDQEDDQIECDNLAKELCKRTQLLAIEEGYYMGLDTSCTQQTDEVFFLKPKQFFDMGGANHEKLFVPGTLLEVVHTHENDQGHLDLAYWFAYVVKSTGGRLTLRWFLCDEPKFKQGRLELKSAKSRFIDEKEEGESDDDDKEKSNGNSKPGSGVFPIKALTFSLHFCHPKIHSLCELGQSIGERHRLPKVLYDHLDNLEGSDAARDIQKAHIEHIFDTRRMNLDKDRPLIEHILQTVKNKAPSYLDLIFAPKDTKATREVLVSCPKLTKLLRATVVKELNQGVFEIHTIPIDEEDDAIKFIYPYDSSYAVLPLDWAINHEDCLSVNPSRNPTPEQAERLETDNNKTSTDDDLKEDGAKNEQNPVTDEEPKPNPNEGQLAPFDSTSDMCLKHLRKTYPKVGGPFTKASDEVLTRRERFVGGDTVATFNEFCPEDWLWDLRRRERAATKFHCCIDLDMKEDVESRFRVMDQLEVTHPTSDATICMGRIRKVVFPLLWVQLSPDCFTLIPYNSTEIYPANWCELHNHKLVSLLPPRKRCLDPSTQNNSKKRKKKANSNQGEEQGEIEQFNLGDIYDRQLDFDFILQEKNNYIKIFFNHKCFTGPSLSKSKICSLPQYVGPGPMHLVLEEVVTKVISVAYVPPRILNDLSSKSFEELLVERNLTNTKNHTFKAKYQKRVHRERVPVCLSPRDIALYCECICEHIKCCYNLFGPKLYDGDDCPSHCRSLTKSNKFMKRATYYREKARQGDYIPINESSPTPTKKPNPEAGDDNGSKTSVRARAAGQDSSESTNSSILSRSEQVQSRASSSSGDGDGTTNDLKETLRSVVEESVQDSPHETEQNQRGSQTATLDATLKMDSYDTYGSTGFENTPESDCQNQPEFEMLDTHHPKIANPEEWTVDDVVQYLDWCQLGMFKSNVELEGIDGQALLLLDHAAINEHFQIQKKSNFTMEEVDKLCRFVELIKTRAEGRL